MLLSGVLFVLILAGCGAMAWLSSRRPRRARSAPPTGASAVPAHTHVYWHPDWAVAADPLAPHPAGDFGETLTDDSARPKGPDDDPEFLCALERQIRGTSGDSGE
jgi:hypothetical protein